MRYALYALLATAFLFLLPKEVEASLISPPSLRSGDISMPYYGTLTITSRLGELSCTEGSLTLYHPQRRDPSGAIESPLLIDDYAAKQTQSVTIGPYEAGTKIVLAIKPGTFLCHGEYLSTDPLHAYVKHTSDAKWSIDWEDSDNPANLDFNDLYVTVRANKLSKPAGSLPFQDQVIAESNVPASYNLPWCSGSHRVSQVPGEGNHGPPYTANAYDFEGSFNVCAPTDGTVLWVEDSFGPGKCDFNNFALRARANVIVIKTDSTTQVTFVHLKKGSALVSPGQKVKRGEEIAVSGNSGLACGAHLHFEFQILCNSLDEANLVRQYIKDGREPRATLAWSCPTKSLYSDGFWINGRYYARLTSGKWYP